MAELLASPVLRAWGDYRRTGFVYLPGGGDQPGGGALTAAVAEIERQLPGSAALTTAGAAFEDAAGPGGPGEHGPVWAGPPDATAVVERQAGYISTARMRDAVLADLARLGGTIAAAALTAVRAPPAGSLGPVRVTSAGTTTEHDRLVLAAGAWTPGLLGTVGLPAAGYRTKSVEYGIYRVDGYCPPAFIDVATGLYGRPATGGLLLGLATTGWDVAPGRPGVDRLWRRSRRDLAARLFPRLRLGSVLARSSAADCYCEPPVLSLRPVTTELPGLFTFTGGSGGAAKSALAASLQAAGTLATAELLSGPEPLVVEELLAAPDLVAAPELLCGPEPLVVEEPLVAAELLAAPELVAAPQLLAGAAGGSGAERDGGR
jgi:glycine/D-amino acid oxidase-like deaminating enzyme